MRGLMNAMNLHVARACLMNTKDKPHETKPYRTGRRVHDESVITIHVARAGSAGGGQKAGLLHC